jgi:endonuclease/exonuclease/phosphatase family metal-dependent hydrolase
MIWRIASYNIRLGLERGLDAVATELRERSADVVALQEVGSYWTMGGPVDMAEHLADAAGYPHRVFVGALFEDGGAYGIALLSRWAITGVDKTELPRRDDEQRVLLRATLASPTPLSLWTTHLSIAVHDRAEQLRWLAAAMAEEAPDILVGDLNTVPSDPLLRALALEPTWPEPAPRTYPTRAPDETLDHILLGSRLRAVEPARAWQSDASDHLPVTVDLKMS